MMLPKALEVSIKGVKCDVCDFKNMDAKFEVYDKWVNEPCPKCGANLLTEEDAESIKRLLLVADVVNFLISGEGEGKKVKGTVEMDGSGKMVIKIGGA